MEESCFLRPVLTEERETPSLIPAEFLPHWKIKDRCFYTLTLTAVNPGHKATQI